MSWVWAGVLVIAIGGWCLLVMPGTDETGLAHSVSAKVRQSHFHGPASGLHRPWSGI